MLRRLIGFTIGFLAGFTAAAYAARRFVPSHGDEMSDELDLAVIATGLELHSKATAFRGGRVSTWMGGVELDLREATLDPAGGRLEINAVMGGIDVIVPRSWRVVTSRSQAWLGGTSLPADADSFPSEAPTLTVDLLAVGAGVTIDRPGDEPAS